MQIPFVNLKRQYFNLQPALDHAFNQVIESGQVMGGAVVSEFERNFAAYLGISYAVACANCTDALEIILRAFEIGVGDEVIVPANGWISAVEVVWMLGAKPVFIEPDPLCYTIDPSNIEGKITDRTKAIIPVHLYGLPADMIKIMEIARKYQLKVIEDCAQAHGAKIGVDMAGSFGDAAAFSFYPTKNLGALGDGGMMVTQSRELAEKLRIIANHGQTEKNFHTFSGRNSRMDTLQAAILQTKLPHLHEWNKRRRTIAHYYKESWKNLEISLPEEPDQSFHIFHLFVIQHEQRDLLAQYLKSQGISTEVHYPYALPRMPVFQSLLHTDSDFPIAVQQADRVLSIPVYPELSDAEVEYIAEKVKEGTKYVKCRTVC